MKLILSLVLALISWTAFGQLGLRDPAFLSKLNVLFAAAAGPCAATDTTNVYDVFIEGFESGSYSNWTLNGTTANITTNYDSSGLATYKPPGVCNQSLYIEGPADGTDTFVRTDLGAAIDLDTIQTTVSFNFYLSAHGANNGTGSPILAWNADGGFGAYSGIWVNKDGGGNSGLVGYGVVSSATIAISVGQWYTIVAELGTDQTQTNCNFKVFSNGSQVGTTGTFQRAAIDMRYIFLGSHDGYDANEHYTGVWDTVAIKTNE